MSASISLAQHCQLTDTGTPDFGYFVTKYGDLEAVASAFSKVARYAFPKDRSLGLKDQMVLLGIGKEKRLQEIAGIFQSMEKQQLMEKRNRSILAHGTVSVSEEEHRLYEKGARDIVSRTVGTADEFEKRLKQATHPTIEIEL
jgi:hypothetical protein